MSMHLCIPPLEANVETSRRENLDRWTLQLTRRLTRLLHGISAHWLLLANLALALYLGLPVLAPILRWAGHPRGADAIYLLFRPLCHQLPERSFFLFGPQAVYSYEELSAFLGGGAVPQRYTGAPEIGFKIAICQRDVAIYGAMLLAGLLFGPLRRRIKPLPWRYFLALILPLAIDGTGQLLGFWESTWWSRLLTGALFGVACVWLAFPYLEEGMGEVHRETSQALRDGS